MDICNARSEGVVCLASYKHYSRRVGGCIGLRGVLYYITIADIRQYRNIICGDISPAVWPKLAAWRVTPCSPISWDPTYTPSNVVPKKKRVLCHKYFRYCHKTNTIVFTILSTNRQANFHISWIVITKVRLFGCLIQVMPEKNDIPYSFVQTRMLK